MKTASILAVLVFSALVSAHPVRRPIETPTPQPVCVIPDLAGEWQSLVIKQGGITVVQNGRSVLIKHERRDGIGLISEDGERLTVMWTYEDGFPAFGLYKIVEARSLIGRIGWLHDHNGELRPGPIKADSFSDDFLR